MMKRILMRIGSLILAVILFWITYINISSGRISLKFGGYLTVADNPGEFWFSIAVAIFFGVLFLLGAILKGEDD